MTSCNRKELNGISRRLVGWWEQRLIQREKGMENGMENRMNDATQKNS